MCFVVGPGPGPKLGPFLSGQAVLQAELAARRLESAVSELHEAKHRAGKLGEELQNAAATLQDMEGAQPLLATRHHRGDFDAVAISRLLPDVFPSEKEAADAMDLYATSKYNAYKGSTWVPGSHWPSETIGAILKQRGIGFILAFSRKSQPRKKIDAAIANIIKNNDRVFIDGLITTTKSVHVYDPENSFGKAAKNIMSSRIQRSPHQCPLHINWFSAQINFLKRRWNSCVSAHFYPCSQPSYG
ncbi:hypothetical protein RI054_03g13380 [Pseudoscourfieldia marina]